MNMRPSTFRRDLCMISPNGPPVLNRLTRATMSSNPPSKPLAWQPQRLKSALMQPSRQYFSRTLSLGVLTLLGACGGGGSSTSSTADYSVEARISGLDGTGLVLKMNGERVTVNTNGVVSFSTRLPYGSTYSVTVEANPSRPAQSCVIPGTNGLGTVGKADVSIGVTCTTEGTAQPSTQVSIDAALQPEVASLIRTIVSPVHAAQTGQWVEIPTDSPSGHSVIMALDQHGSIILGAVTKSAYTELSARSTLLTLIILAMGDTSSQKNLSSVLRQIEEDPAFPSLANEVTSTLKLGLSPTDNEALLHHALSIATRIAREEEQAEAATAQMGAIASNYLSHPFVLTYDTLLGGTALSIGNGGKISNLTPLNWSISTKNSIGSDLQTNDRIDPYSIESVPVDYQGTTLTFKQTPETRVIAATEIVAGAVEGALSFVSPTSCSGNLVQIAVTEAISSRGSFATTPDSFWISLESIMTDPQTWVAIGDACARGELQKISKAISSYLGKISKIKGAYDLGKAALTGMYLNEFWDRGGTPFGICFTKSGEVTNCLRTLELSPPLLKIAAGGGKGVLEFNAIDVTGKSAPIPAGVKCETSAPAGVLTLDSEACEITVSFNMFTAGGPYKIDARDAATGLQAQATVNVVIPSIFPEFAVLEIGDVVALNFVDPDGEPIEMPIETTWAFLDPSGTGISFVGGSQGTLWGGAQKPGVVTVSARYPNGLEFSQATIEVIQPSGGEGDPDEPDLFVGSWIVQYVDSVTDGREFCGPESGSLVGQITKADVGTYTFSVAGQQIGLSGSGNNLSGSASFSYPEDGGITSGSMSFSLTPSSLSGSGTWSWRNATNTMSCSGTTRYSGSR